MKLLEKVGVQIDAQMEAAVNNARAAYTNGYVGGYLEELAITKSTSNALTLGAGMLIIQGFRIVVDAPETFTLTALPASGVTLQYQLVAGVTVADDSQNSFASLRLQLTANLVQDDILGIGTGTYEIELCRLSVTSAGILKVERTVEKIMARGLDGISFNPRDKWVLGNSYEATETGRDVVSYENGMYCCEKSHIASDENKPGNTEYWKLLLECTGGGSDITVVQTTGQSTADVMSQKAVTDALSTVSGGGERIIAESVIMQSDDSFEFPLLTNIVEVKGIASGAAGKIKFLLSLPAFDIKDYEMVDFTVLHAINEDLWFLTSLAGSMWYDGMGGEPAMKIQNVSGEPAIIMFYRRID